MISKSQIKLIRSLQQKKYRDKTGLFVAEGRKVIDELSAAGFALHSLFSTNVESFSPDNVYEISPNELQKISFLKTANTSLGLFKIPKIDTIETNGIIVVLDAIRDPGNLGTIIRLCDWFDVAHLVCSMDTVDCYNPKVVQASMGSIARVKITYRDLPDFIRICGLPVLGACMEGDSLYTQKLPEEALIIMGNEANGISEELIDLLTDKITIPQFGDQQDTDSLNVATATAIILSEFKRFTGK